MMPKKKKQELPEPPPTPLSRRTVISHLTYAGFMAEEAHELADKLIKLDYRHSVAIWSDIETMARSERKSREEIRRIMYRSPEDFFHSVSVIKAEIEHKEIMAQERARKSEIRKYFLQATSNLISSDLALRNAGQYIKQSPSAPKAPELKAD